VAEYSNLLCLTNVSPTQNHADNQASDRGGRRAGNGGERRLRLCTAGVGVAWPLILASGGLIIVFHVVRVF